MNKYLWIILLLIFSVLSSNADGWDEFSDLDRIWDGQKSITNKQFEDVMQQIEKKSEEKKEKKEKKRRKKLFGTGTTLHEELAPDNTIQEMDSLKPSEEDWLINLPVSLNIDGKLLEKGFYKVLGEKDAETNKIYLKFYQSQYFKAQIEAVETDDDFGEDKLNFVKMVPYNESFVKIIYGSIAFNAFVFVNYDEE